MSIIESLVKSIVAKVIRAADFCEDDNNEMATGQNRGQEVLSTRERSKLIRACCKIKTLGGSGSGSLCDLNGKLCVMTNNHVLSSKDQARQAEAVFCAIEDEDDDCSVCLEPDDFFFTDKDLDYTFVAVQDEPKLKSGTIEPLNLVDDSLKIDDYTYTVQYPRGGGRKDSYGSVCEISKCGRYVYYNNDTDYGSSGSPVFKGTLVLALHHQRDPRRKANRGVSMKFILNDMYKKVAELGTGAEAKRKAVAEAEAKQKAAAAVAEAKRKAAAVEAEARRKAAAAAATTDATISAASPTSSSGATVGYSPGAHTTSTATSAFSPTSTLDGGLDGGFGGGAGDGGGGLGGDGLLDSPAFQVRKIFPILTEALGNYTNKQLKQKANQCHQNSSMGKMELSVALMKTQKQRMTATEMDDDDTLINKWIKAVKLLKASEEHIKEADKSAVAKEVRRVLKFG